MKKLLLLFLLLPAISFAALTAKSWLIADEHGNVVSGQNIHEQRSIASITKLMTAMVVLDAEQDLDETIDGITRRDLIRSMLIKSDNKAAEILCEQYPKGRSACINDMNKKAEKLGLTDTRYVDPSGLSIMNISTAQDLIQIVIASSQYPMIVNASNTSQSKIKNKKHTTTIYNTNPLVRTKEFIVSKTGYINAAGGCIVVMTYNKIVIVLGSKNTHTRIPELVSLLNK